ncbi:MAG TPA: diadenylate cyclase CdaA [Saprospiraceae bacterium]|nr:diadenylate cyclase CdaA [Saprospiraceae bacterium]HMQ82113.1 diadenylate cyclase CdaA [Saprospiraceae bacterium]
MQELFEVGFLSVRIWDVLDILIVGYLMYQIYKLLRGNIAFNIFIGVLMLYGIWFLVNQLNMQLLSAVLNQLVSVGIIVLIIIFQPEVRRFLLFLGNTTLRQRSNFVRRLLLDQSIENRKERNRQIDAIKSALLKMSKKKTGALIVFANNQNLEGVVSGGVRLNAEISEPLLESIFKKESPLHDGALIIADGKMRSAGCILPVSENPNLPKSVGLRHRAAVGISERLNVAVFLCSEETGYISMSVNGQLIRKLQSEELERLLNEYYH